MNKHVNRRLKEGSSSGDYSQEEMALYDPTHPSRKELLIDVSDDPLNLTC